MAGLILLVTNLLDVWNKNGLFEDVTVASGIGGDSMSDLGWGGGFYDFTKMDSKISLWLVGTFIRRWTRTTWKISYRQPNKLYLNTGKPRLLNVGQRAGPGLQSAAAGPLLRISTM